MSTPQQPEIARSQRSEVTADVAAKARAATGAPGTDPGTGPVPEDNAPGHHPDVEQDKPQGPPPEPRARRPKARPRTGPRKPKRSPEDETQRFPFAVPAGVSRVTRLVGVSPDRAAVEVGEGELRVRFGPWSVETPLENVESASEALVPLGWPSLVTSRQGAVRIRFREPVPGALPFGLLPGRSMTVTVDDPDGLLETLSAASSERVPAT